MYPISPRKTGRDSGHRHLRSGFGARSLFSVFIEDKRSGRDLLLRDEPLHPHHTARRKPNLDSAGMDWRWGSGTS